MLRYFRLFIFLGISCSELSGALNKDWAAKFSDLCLKSDLTCGTRVDGHHLDVDGVLAQVVDIWPAVALLLDISHGRAHALLVWLLEEVGEGDDKADVEGVPRVILRSGRGASWPGS